MDGWLNVTGLKFVLAQSYHLEARLKGENMLKMTALQREGASIPFSSEGAFPLKSCHELSISPAFHAISSFKAAIRYIASCSGIVRSNRPQEFPKPVLVWIC